MSLVSEVIRLLEREGALHALIGAAAMNAHGVNRASVDIDLLCVDSRLLSSAVWRDLQRPARRIEIHKGDLEDSLAGAVRLIDKTEMVDVVVGRHRWEAELIETATPATVNGVPVPVVSAAGLVLLKLNAGSARDAWDVQALLEMSRDRDQLQSAVETTLPRLSSEAKTLWADVLARARPRAE
jgi:hypothetical protein